MTDDDQWNSAMLLCSFLQPFAVVTDILQGEKYTSLYIISATRLYLVVPYSLICILIFFSARNLSHPPDSWNLYNCTWPQQDAAVVTIRKFTLADMERQWNIVHPCTIFDWFYNSQVIKTFSIPARRLVVYRNQR